MPNLFYILLERPFINILVGLTALTPGQYAAVAVIILTLIVRFALLIPSKKMAQSQRRMAELQPLISELQKEYGDDKNGFAQAQMALLKDNNVNPFGSCLLLLPQIIVLIFLNRSIGLAFGSDAVKHLYSFVPHITSVNTSFFWTDLTGHDQTYILPILAGALQFIQTWMVTPRPKRNPSQEPDPTAAAQRSMLYVLPLFTVFLGKSITAALFLYWVVSSIFSVIQQYFVNKEKLALAGVSKAIDTAEQKHPEKAKQLEKAKTNPEMKEVLDLETKSEKNGISVTVRRKK